MLIFYQCIFLIIISIIFSCNFVVFSSNPVYSLLWLVLSFIFAASLLFFLGCEFLALIFIVIYVGAITILFLFVVMLLDIKIKNLEKTKTKALIGTLGFINLLLLFLTVLISNNFTNLNYIGVTQFLLLDKINLICLNWYDFLFATNEIEIFSIILYDFFAIQFLLVGFILLGILIGIVYLVNFYRNFNIVDQPNFKQISVLSNFFK